MQNKIFKFISSPLMLCIISAFFLVLSFPKFDLFLFAWIGLVPFLFAIEKKTRGQAFKLGFFCGLIFFSTTLYWFINMAPTGGIPVFLSFLACALLSSYLSLYFGLFGFLITLFKMKNRIANLFFIPSLWVVLEFLRSGLFSGFGWGALGHSQYQQLAIIQISDMTGVFGVSFLIVMVNVLLKEILQGLFTKQKKNLKTVVLSSIIVGFLLAAALFYGMQRIMHFSSLSNEKARIAVIQGNVDQEKKWDMSYWPEIFEKHFSLTKKAAGEKPDLIIWPETAFPGYLWNEKERFEELKNFVRKINIPLLVGIVTRDGDRIFNSAILISSRGEETARYSKLHLVPFGEYLPLRKQFPFLSALVPIEDFSSGGEAVLFPVSKTNKKLSVLICFEDTVTWVSRVMTRKGANLLVNMTNDAWFLDTKEPFLHLQGSVFQAVQNRRSLVRAANTGISCFINAFGDITSIVKNVKGKTTYVDGYRVDQVSFVEKMSFYTKFGDVFAYLCFGCILMIAISKNKYY